VLPVYNEAAVLEELASQVTAAARACGMRYEIVFVNDGSRDSSGETLDALAARDEHVRVIHLARNFGHQAAVHAGLAHARGDAVVLMDSDLQDSPLTIPRFVAAWREGADVVYAVRASRKEALWKRLLFAGFHRLLSRMAQGRIPVDAGNFSLMDRRVVRQLLALDERDRYLPGLRSWVGFRQRGIEVERQARYDGRPRVSLWGLWRLAKTAMFSFSTFPLAVFSLIGYSALAIFLVLAGYSLYCRLFTDLAIPGWTSHILSASFFGALNALGISILGEYVVRIYDQVRGRPVYVVDRTVNAAHAKRSGEPLSQTRAAETITEPADQFDDPSTAELIEQLASLIATIQAAKLDKATLAITETPVDRASLRHSL
jgi:dolichol-phosphate mannosyltransferase